MSCNCNNRPCTCANANCACPPDYTFQPATLTCVNPVTCDETLSTQCIYTSSIMNCAQIAAGATLDSVLTKFDQLLCMCGSCSGGTGQNNLKLYYVDSHNTTNGDGSITNPFKTIDLAYNAVIGSGTVDNPQNPAGIYVFWGSYTTSQNIYLNGCFYYFLPGTLITFTGNNTYFIDSIASTTIGISGGFEVLGYLTFRTSSGGFLRNIGNTSAGGGGKNIYVEFAQAAGNTIGSSIPLIYHSKNTNAAFPTDLYTSIKLQSPVNLSWLASAYNDTIFYNGGKFQIDLGGAEIVYGIDYITGIYTGVSGGHIITYNNSDNSSFTNGQSIFSLTNGYVSSNGCTDMIGMTGVFNNFYIDNIKSRLSIGGTLPSTFINIGNISLGTSGTNGFRFLLKDIYLYPSCFALGDSSIVVKYSGTVPQSLNYLEMQNCVLYNPLTISNTINLGGSNDGGNVVPTYNIIKGQFHLTQIPTSNAGLVSGDVWSKSNILNIVP